MPDALISPTPIAYVPPALLPAPFFDVPASVYMATSATSTPPS
jgi:hypothetical protein